MLTDAEAKGYRFNYSEAEWRLIADTTKSYFPEGLPKKFCEHLLLAAHVYKQESRHLQRPNYHPPRERAKIYKRVQRLSRELLEALREVEYPEYPTITVGEFYDPGRCLDEVEYPAEYEYPAITLEELCDPGRRTVKRHYCPRRTVNPATEFLWTLHVLNGWAMRAEMLAAINSDEGLTRIKSQGWRIWGEQFREQDRPRQMYFGELLRAWRSIGGKLKTSRHPKTGKVTGPLARFFQAAAGPVMGNDAPSAETIRDLVNRELKEGSVFDHYRVDTHTE